MARIKKGEKTPSRASSSRSRASASKKKPASAAADKAFTGAKRDGLILLFIALAIIVLLREWFHVGALVGDILHHGIAGLVGVLSIIFPLVLAFFAYVFFRGESTRVYQRSIIAVVLMIISVDGLVHIFIRPEHIMDDMTVLEDAGGLLGWGAGGLAEALLSVWAAVPLLILLFLWAILYGTQISLGTILSYIRDFFSSDSDNEEDREQHAVASPSLPYDKAHTIEDEDKEETRVIPQYSDYDSSTSSDSDKTEVLPLSSLGSSDDVVPDFLPQTVASKPLTVPNQEKTPVSSSSSSDTLSTPSLSEKTVGPAVNDNYQLPDVSLLKKGKPHAQRTEANDQVCAALQQVFSDFNVDAKVVDFQRGPTVTQYEVLKLIELRTYQRTLLMLLHRQMCVLFRQFQVKVQ